MSNYEQTKFCNCLLLCVGCPPEGTKWRGSEGTGDEDTVVGCLKTGDGENIFRVLESKF